LYHRFCLSFREVEELLTGKGVVTLFYFIEFPTALFPVKQDIFKQQWDDGQFHIYSSKIFGRFLKPGLGFGYGLSL
jgi:hypothetical protein